MKRLMFFTAAMAGLALSVLAAEPVTILAYGDSITQGGKNFDSYRSVLVPELKKRGLPVAFVGPRKDGASAHAGYGGKSTKALRGMAEGIYAKHPADIVLLHSGHNSNSANKPVPGILDDTEGIIEAFRKINPEVHVLLAQVIPAGKLPKYSYIPQLNEDLAGLAKRLQDKGYKVTLVNQAEGFDWKQDTIGDKVHPSPTGSKKMADKWLTALLPLLDGK